jgi:general secretion pathway protein G
MIKDRARSGFTLIELMVVVIIIAALAGMVLPRVLPASDAAKAKIARGDIANITTSIQLYKLHEGSYPKSLADLRKKSTSGDWKGSYLEKAAVDPWKRMYHYKYPGGHNSSFDLWSDGAETLTTDDNINSWE